MALIHNLGIPFTVGADPNIFFNIFPKTYINKICKITASSTFTRNLTTGDQHHNKHNPNKYR